MGGALNLISIRSACLLYETELLAQTASKTIQSLFIVYRRLFTKDSFGLCVCVKLANHCNVIT